MIRINLLPPAQRPPQWRTGRMFFIAGLVVFLALTGIFSYNAIVIYQGENQLQQIQTSYELLRPTEDKMVETLNRQQVLKAKNAILLNLTKERFSWYAILTNLSAKTPPNLWLTGLKADKGLLTISGMARNYPDVAVFIQKFEQDELFVDPALLKTGKDAVLPVTRFEMTVKFKGM